MPRGCLSFFTAPHGYLDGESINCSNRIFCCPIYVRTPAIITIYIVIMTRPLIRPSACRTSDLFTWDIAGNYFPRVLLMFLLFIWYPYTPRVDSCAFWCGYHTIVSLDAEIRASCGVLILRTPRGPEQRPHSLSSTNSLSLLYPIFTEPVRNMNWTC